MMQPEKYKIESLAEELWNVQETWKFLLVDFKLLVYSFFRPLLWTYYVPSLVLCPGVIKVNKTVKALAS